MKQYVLMRTDLGMSSGKMCAQAAHAASPGFYRAMKEARYNKWFADGCSVIVLAVNSEQELSERITAAELSGLFNTAIYDAGKTEVEPSTLTCGAIGPGEGTNIDAIVSELKLL